MVEDALSGITRRLKTSLEVSEKLRNRRKELKGQLMKEGLSEADEARLARELDAISKTLVKLDEKRIDIYDEIATDSANSGTPLTQGNGAGLGTTEEPAPDNSAPGVVTNAETAPGKTVASPKKKTAQG